MTCGWARSASAQRQNPPTGTPEGRVDQPIASEPAPSPRPWACLSPRPQLRDFTKAIVLPNPQALPNPPAAGSGPKQRTGIVRQPLASAITANQSKSNTACESWSSGASGARGARQAPRRPKRGCIVTCGWARSASAQRHGYYGHYCYLPLYIFAGDGRNIDAAEGSLEEVQRIVEQLRQRVVSISRSLRSQPRRLGLGLGRPARPGPPQPPLYHRCSGPHLDPTCGRIRSEYFSSDISTWQFGFRWR